MNWRIRIEVQIIDHYRLVRQYVLDRASEEAHVIANTCNIGSIFKDLIHTSYVGIEDFIAPVQFEKHGLL